MATIKFEIEVEEIGEKEFSPLHQAAWQLTDKNNVDHAEFCTTIPGSAPFIKILEGANAGKRYVVKLSSLEQLCLHLKDLTQTIVNLTNK